MVVGPLGGEFQQVDPVQELRSARGSFRRRGACAELLIDGELLGRLGPAGAAELDRQGVADRFGQADQPVARRGIGDGQAAGRARRTVAIEGPLAAMPEPGGQQQERPWPRPAPASARVIGIGVVPGLGAEIGLGRDKSPGFVARSRRTSAGRSPGEELDQGDDRIDVGRHGEGLDARIGAPALEGGRAPRRPSRRTASAAGVELVSMARVVPFSASSRTSRPASGSWSSRGSTTRRAIVSWRRRRAPPGADRLLADEVADDHDHGPPGRPAHPCQADAQPASWATSSAWPPAPGRAARGAARRRPAAARPRSDR